MMVFQRNYGWWKKNGFGMNYGRWKNNLYETNYGRSGQQKKMMVFQKNYGWWKKKMGLGRIMEDKKIISMKRIMEDLVNKKKWWYFKRIMDDEKKRWVWDELWKIKK